MRTEPMGAPTTVPKAPAVGPEASSSSPPPIRYPTVERYPLSAATVETPWGGRMKRPAAAEAESSIFWALPSRLVHKPLRVAALVQVPTTFRSVTTAAARLAAMAARPPAAGEKLLFRRAREAQEINSLR